MKILLILFIPVLLFSCSSIQPIETKKRPLTEREKILEYYRSLREQNIRKKPPIKKKRYTYVPKKVRRPKIKMVDIESQKIEIEQRLVFFCMKRRKSSRFDEDNSCEQFAKSIYSKCQTDYIDGDARLTRCVKSRLK